GDCATQDEEEEEHKNLRKTVFLFSHSSPSSTSATLLEKVFYTAEDTVMRDLKFFLRKSTCSCS
ncbi:hypothetical protein DPX16_14856, partial [Anabarilius grahami]